MTLPNLGWDAEKLSTDRQEQRSLVGEAAFVVNLNGAVIACCIVVLRGLIQRMLLIGWTFNKVRLARSGSWSEGCGNLDFSLWEQNVLFHSTLKGDLSNEYR